MRILIPSIHVPFIYGGAQILTEGLERALIEAGHEVETIRFPFKFSPENYLSKAMDYCKGNDFENFNGYQIDKVITLQFPAYYVQHPNKVLWLMHQHRAVYDLYEQQGKHPELMALREKITSYDSSILREIPKRYTIGKVVSDRLRKYNGIESTSLHHPPVNAESFFTANAENYIFCPSRLEALKRQDLLIKALQYTKSSVGVIIAGVGGQLEIYKELVERLNLKDRVKFVGYISEREKQLFYARSLAVFFGPYDEDYGYITLEAMLSGKPVITCSDSGGPLEFVVDNETGYIVEPEPEQIAEKIDFIVYNKEKSRAMGENGLLHYQHKNINWKSVIETLLA